MVVCALYVSLIGGEEENLCALLWESKIHLFSCSDERKLNQRISNILELDIASI
jgi:hypothetical protein